LLLLFLLLVSALWIALPEQSAALRATLEGFLRTGIPVLGSSAEGVAAGSERAAQEMENTAPPATLLSDSQFPEAAAVTAPAPSSAAPLPFTSPGTCGHALDEPFGEDPVLVMHRVQSGENLALYADQYQTTTDAILAVNSHLPMPVWENWIIVLPVGTENVTGLPPFEPYQALGTSLSLAEFARQLDADPQSLYKYNAFRGMCRGFSGWLLIPRAVISTD
jgi:hypothetical protein